MVMVRPYCITLVEYFVNFGTILLFWNENVYSYVTFTIDRYLLLWTRILDLIRYYFLDRKSLYDLSVLPS